MARLRLEGLDHVPVVVGGIISGDDALVLNNLGVAAVYTPKDFALDRIMADIVGVVERSLVRRAEASPLSSPQPARQRRNLAT
jgi:(2R)-ethylmalonyl-CoA mutase